MSNVVANEAMGIFYTSPDGFANVAAVDVEQRRSSLFSQVERVCFVESWLSVCAAPARQATAIAEHRTTDESIGHRSRRKTAEADEHRPPLREIRRRPGVIVYRADAYFSVLGRVGAAALLGAVFVPLP